MASMWPRLVEPREESTEHPGSMRRREWLQCGRGSSSRGKVARVNILCWLSDRRFNVAAARRAAERNTRWSLFLGRDPTGFNVAAARRAAERFLRDEISARKRISDASMWPRLVEPRKGRRERSQPGRERVRAIQCGRGSSSRGKPGRHILRKRLARPWSFNVAAARQPRKEWIPRPIVDACDPASMWPRLTSRGRTSCKWSPG